MAIEKIEPAEPRSSAEMNLEGAETSDTTQLSREGSNELSSAEEAPLVKRNWYQQIWDSEDAWLRDADNHCSAACHCDWLGCFDYCQRHPTGSSCHP
jgi:hypothetical protein